MLEFENRISIDCDRESVFAVATDLTKVPKWNYFVRSVTHMSGSPGQVGAVYHQVRREDEQQLRIAERTEGKKFAVETLKSTGPELRREMSFEGDGETTHIIDRWELNLGVPSLIEPLAAGRVKKAVRENLGKLKILLETGSVTLQDGRSHLL
jgi:hypothetical protein